MENKTKFQTEPIVSRKLKRLPIHKTVEFKFPPMINPKVAEKYEARKINVINQRDFKRMYQKFDKNDLFLGSLKLL